MIKKVIEIDVEQVKAMGGLNALQDSLKKTETTSQSLKTELRKLKEQLASLPEGSAEYNKIAERAGQVSDKIGDINTKIKNLGSDTRGIDAVVQGTQVLSGAFSVATSASALLGTENKQLEETMLKVESAIGLTVGIQSIANALQKESALVIGVSNIATKAQVAIQGAYALAVGTTTGALKTFRVALATTGIGALVVGLGFLISKLTESSGATEDATQTQDQFNNSLSQTKELYDGIGKAIDNYTKVQLLKAKIRGASESELQAIEQNGIDRKIELLKQEQRNLNTQLLNDKLSAESRKQLVKELNRLDNDLIDARNEKETSALSFELEVANKRRAELEKQKQEADNRSKEAQAKRIEERKAVIADAESLQNALDEIQRAKNKRDADLKADAKKILDDVEKRLTPEETPLQKLTREYNERLSILKQAGESELLLTAEFTTAKLSLETQETEARKLELEKRANDKKLLQQQELNIAKETFGKIAFILGENSKVGKAFAVGQALINTYQGITAELATKALTPYEIGLKVVNVAYIAKTGFDAVKNIMKTNNSVSGSAGGGAPSGGGASSTPQFNIVSQSATNQLSQTISRQQQQPIQTYVVGNQVTTQQALDRNAIQTSTFG